MIQMKILNLPPGLWRVIILGCVGYFAASFIAAAAMNGLQ